jgi:hypothetical protein
MGLPKPVQIGFLFGQRLSRNSDRGGAPEPFPNPSSLPKCPFYWGFGRLGATGKGPSGEKRNFGTASQWRPLLSFRQVEKLSRVQHLQLPATRTMDTREEKALLIFVTFWPNAEVYVSFLRKQESSLLCVCSCVPAGQREL